MKNQLLPQADGISISEYGLEINRVLNFEDWKSLLSEASRVKRTYLSILADITAYGRTKFGDEAVNDALEQLEFDLQDATKAEVISLVNLDQRTRYNLTSEHAYILGSKLDSPEEREKWAQTVLKEKLTAYELKKSIETGEVTRKSDLDESSGRSDGIPSIQSVRFHWEKWERQFKDRNAILKLAVPERRKILDMLHPIIELAALVEKSLADKK